MPPKPKAASKKPKAAKPAGAKVRLSLGPRHDSCMRPRCAPRTPLASPANGLPAHDCLPSRAHTEQKPLSGYMLFSKGARAGIIKSNPGIAFGEVRPPLTTPRRPHTPSPPHASQGLTRRTHVVCATGWQEARRRMGQAVRRREGKVQVSSRPALPSSPLDSMSMAVPECARAMATKSTAAGRVILFAMSRGVVPCRSPDSFLLYQSSEIHRKQHPVRRFLARLGLKGTTATRRHHPRPPPARRRDARAP